MYGQYYLVTHVTPGFPVARSEKDTRLLYPPRGGLLTPERWGLERRGPPPIPAGPHLGMRVRRCRKCDGPKPEVSCVEGVGDAVERREYGGLRAGERDGACWPAHMKSDRYGSGSDQGRPEGSRTAGGHLEPLKAKRPTTRSHKRRWRRASFCSPTSTSSTVLSTAKPSEHITAQSVSAACSRWTTTVHVSLPGSRRSQLL